MTLLETSNLHRRNKYTGERPFLRQYHLFKQPLEEKYRVIDEYDIVVNHSNGKCYYKNIEFGLTYPISWLKLFKSNEKLIDYFFSGYLNPNSTQLRNWVLDYNDKNSIINFSNRGRTIPRDLFDTYFFDTMSHSKFCLFPQGYPFRFTKKFWSKRKEKTRQIIKRVGNHPRRITGLVTH